MTRATRTRVVLVGWLLVVLPPGRTALEATMGLHMLVQMPLLVLSGWWLGGHLQTTWPAVLNAVRSFRWALLVSAAGGMCVWMIPRLLDLATSSLFVDAAKATTLTLVAGLPLRLAWDSFGPVVRGLVHVEALATLWRLAWLYLESPARLCLRYRIDDQYRLGTLLVVVGGVYALWLVYHALRETPATRAQPPRY